MSRRIFFWICRRVFFLNSFVGGAQKNPPGKLLAKSPKLYTTKISNTCWQGPNLHEQKRKAETPDLVAQDAEASASVSTYCNTRDVLKISRLKDEQVEHQHGRSFLRG